jgi:hypothetical protein
MGVQASLTAAPCPEAGYPLRALSPKAARLLLSRPMGVFLGAPNKTRCALFPGQEGVVRRLTATPSHACKTLVSSPSTGC